MFVYVLDETVSTSHNVCVTPSRKLKEVLNVRLDEPLAKELRRIAVTSEQTESEVARWLLRYGIEVSRRLQAAQMSEPFSWEKDEDDPFEPARASSKSMPAGER